MTRRRRLLDTMREAQQHVEDVTHRLSHMKPDDPAFEGVLDEYDNALLARTEAEKAHAR